MKIENDKTDRERKFDTMVVRERERDKKRKYNLKKETKRKRKEGNVYLTTYILCLKTMIKRKRETERMGETEIHTPREKHTE